MVAYDGNHMTATQITAYLYSMTCMEIEGNSPEDNIRIKAHLHSCDQCKAQTRVILNEINARYS